ncbi:hypothetical protein VTO42DRAFT_3666 [Malbranchea cinnamomea]
MAGDTVSYLLSYVAWGFIPRYVTSFLQNLYYRLTIRAGSPHPQPGSPRHKRHYRRIYIFVITAYLLYTLVETYIRIRSDVDFYQLLGVLPTTDDRTIKSRFRRLAAIHHPDKLLHSATADGSSDAIFVQLKLAQDTLLDPTKRFAYDRFGKDVVQGTKAKSIRELLYSGLLALLPQYLSGLFVMLVLNRLWFSPWGRYWRSYVFFALLTLELSLLTHPTGVFMPSVHLPFWLTKLLHLENYYLLPFQILSLARRVSVTLNIFISQLSPPVQNSQSKVLSAAEGAVITPQLQRQLVQLAQLSRVNDVEVTKLLQLELAPFKGDKEHVERLRREMKEWLEVGSAKESAEVKEAIARATARRKEGGD